MNKLLVIVQVPSIDEQYDILIPINKKIGTIKNVIINSINEINEYSISNLDKLKLYDKESGTILDNNLYVKNSVIRNGSILLLI